MNEWMHKWMNEWEDGWMNRWIKWMNEWTTKQTNIWSVYSWVSRQIKVCNSIKYNVTQTVTVLSTT